MRKHYFHGTFESTENARVSYNDGDGEEKEKRSSTGTGGDAEQETIGRAPEGNRTEGRGRPLEGQARGEEEGVTEC